MEEKSSLVSYMLSLNKLKNFHFKGGTSIMTPQQFIDGLRELKKVDIADD
jgi:coproporphyrinogen III oxidase-like Fe-S oxidoreductase